ncbi:MAG: Putative disulfide-isomerase [uncultured Aureispira sp.]|uniref:Disulfide-isomerase n=1 Tax=uncultured Aureispira sp. TaxID=1331704 RepID=A0A6S6UC91_9BACT|nr:MAG: Putative disulfide-isomerase [uncultured Aureispira sp.]
MWISKKLFQGLTVGLLLAGSTMNAQITFEQGTWDEVKAKAEKENKPIFVDAYTTWCGPCKWMSKEIFSQEEVGVYMKQNFIAYKMDMEKGEGPDFAKNNNVVAYPTLLYFDAKGDMIHKGVGARDAEGLIDLSNAALDPSKQLVAFVEKYEAGTRDKDFLMTYLTVLNDCGEDLEAPFKAYWEKIDDEEKQTAETLELMLGVTSSFGNFKSPITQYFLAHKTAYETATSKEEIADILNTCYLYGVWNLAKMEDKKEAKVFNKELLEAFPAAKKEFKKRLAYMKATMETPPDAAKVNKAYSQCLKVTNNWSELNSVAWNVYEKEDDLKKLKLGLGWINRSIEIEENYFNVDTKAFLLYKMKSYTEAKVVAEKAIKLARAAGTEDASIGTIELLNKINVELEAVKD